MAELQAGGPGRRLYQRRARPVPAPDQGGKCKSCRACWSRDIPNVTYAKH